MFMARHVDEEFRPDHAQVSPLYMFLGRQLYCHAHIYKMYAAGDRRGVVMETAVMDVQYWRQRPERSSDSCPSSKP